MELSIIRFIQQFHTTWLDAFYELATQFGEETILIAIIASIYWCVDKKFARILAFTTIFSMLMNNSLKEIFSFDRPIGKPGIRSLRIETATGKSFPSGHTQTSSTFYSVLAMHYKRKWLFVLAGLLIFLVGFSRVYLGVHYPKDIVVAWVLGISIAVIIYKIMISKDNFGIFMIGGVVIGLVLLPFSPSEDYYKALGIMLGLALSYFFEERFVKFDMNTSLFKKVIRTTVGIVILLGLRIVLKSILPHSLWSDLIRYFIIVYVGIGVYPMAFKWLSY